MQTELLNVAGMTCGSCTAKVTQALRATAGVGDAKVSLSAGEATVQYDERLTSPDKLKSAVKDAGYEIGVTEASPNRQAKGCCCG